MRREKRLLAVDDNLVVLESYAEMLPADYDIEFAMTGGQALRKAERLRPGAILLDRIIPDMDGLEVCRELRTRAELDDTVVILVSAASSLTDKADGIAAGADDYLAKPLRESDLRRCLLNHLSLCGPSWSGR